MFSIRFAFCSLLFLLGIFSLLNFYDDLSIQTNLKRSARLAIISFGGIFLSFVIFCTWNYLNPYRVTEDKLAVETASYDKQYKVQVKDVLKGQGEEPVYIIECFRDTLEIPESVYQAYIGDENNSLTLHFEETSLYVSYSLLKHNFDKSSAYTISRVTYPWQAVVQPFTDEEISEFINLLLDKGRKLDQSDFSFGFLGLAIGMTHENCLNNGAVRLSEWP